MDHWSLGFEVEVDGQEIDHLNPNDSVELAGAS